MGVVPMKSHRIRRAWIVSFAVHFCLAVIFTYITINPKYTNEHDVIKVSFLKVTPIPVKERTPFVEKPVVIPTPTPDLRINTQAESISRRSLAVREVKTMQPTPTSAPSGRDQFSPKHAQVTNIPASFQNQSTGQPLATTADVPVASDSPLAAQLGSGGALADGIGEGSGSGLGEGKGRGSFGTQAGISQGRTQNRIGLNSLINREGAADIDESLAGISDNMTLGNGVPPLPTDVPGAIIQGRGNDIVGRLNLVRLDDPLHPNADI